MALLVGVESHLNSEPPETMVKALRPFAPSTALWSLQLHDRNVTIESELLKKRQARWENPLMTKS
jgi:hypothetical protein